MREEKPGVYHGLKTLAIWLVKQLSCRRKSPNMQKKMKTNYNPVENLWQNCATNELCSQGHRFESPSFISLRACVGTKVNKRRDLFERKAIDLIFTASANKFILLFSFGTMFSFLLFLWYPRHSSASIGWQFERNIDNAWPCCLLFINSRWLNEINQIKVCSLLDQFCNPFFEIVFAWTN